MSTNHTRTPWVASFLEGAKPECAIYSYETAERVAECHSRADAEFITNACNANDAFVQALRAVKVHMLTGHRKDDGKILDLIRRTLEATGNAS